MHAPMTTMARPMGDDWLTRDPESFGDEAEGAGGEGVAPAPVERWRGLREDLMLYVAGITTGLAVVVAVLLLVSLLENPAVAVMPPSAASSAAGVGSVAAR